MSSPLEKLNSKVFSEQLHTKFLVPLDGRDALPLELVEVQEGSAAPGMELFFLHFRGPQSPRLVQQIHSLQHEKLGSLDLFLTAIAGDQEGITYESVFHRYLKKP